MATQRGIAYPLTLEDGQLAIAADADLIRTHIYSVLETEPKERVMAMNYGTPNLLFNTVADVFVIASAVQRSLSSQIPDVVFSVSGELNEGGAVLLTVEWTLLGILQPPIRFELES